MPLISFLKCTQCDFKTSNKSSQHLYVLDENQQKIICPHPVEASKISQVLKISRDDAFSWLMQDYQKISPEVKKQIDDHTGIEHRYLCLDCLTESFFNPTKETLKCPRCYSTNLAYTNDLENQPCPKCHQGTLKKVNTGIN